MSTRKRRQIYHHYLKMDYLLLTFRIKLKYSMIILFNSVPLNVNDCTSQIFITRCNNLLETTEINADKVFKIIWSLDCNKAHSWNDMSVSMVKNCDFGIVQPFCLIYEMWLHTGVFPDNCKKGNILPIHKKERRQLEKSHILRSIKKYLFVLLYHWRLISSHMISVGQSSVQY